MALKIRLQRKGAAHRPVYRVVVAESTCRRDGRHVEVLGHYSPKAQGSDPKHRVDLERYDYWYSKGARPTDTARTLVNRIRREKAAEAAAVPAEA
ncbi:30S ribosomal protein S16 [Rubellicoccus peritrichatus]|uniref:Small ribosomal subunit protein bS16 n=1 Tax=Rubellicoccus peritrichatus TaxID=3080537 RepID=A0AAQ3LA67_9BACT|nr:30S ribosomal protein S16 [Puniceicoccus sp. CR14]WOO41517.1 30S ribosomal protein S16 [Puniceicoccus sp. CR14]